MLLYKPLILRSITMYTEKDDLIDLLPKLIEIYMKPLNKKTLNIILWTARVWSILSIGFFLLIIVGHLFFPDESDVLPTSIDIVAMLFNPLGLLVGMVIAWKRERLGGIITICSLIVFYMLIIIPRDAFRATPTFLILAGPGFLFLLYSFLINHKTP